MLHCAAPNTRTTSWHSPADLAETVIKRGSRAGNANVASSPRQVGLFSLPVPPTYYGMQIKEELLRIQLLGRIKESFGVFQMPRIPPARVAKWEISQLSCGTSRKIVPFLLVPLGQYTEFSEAAPV